jgi:hypothetical protein
MSGQKRQKKGDSHLGDYISFCWDGPVKRIDADHFLSMLKILFRLRNCESASLA